MLQAPGGADKDEYADEACRLESPEVHSHFARIYLIQKIISGSEAGLYGMKSLMLWNHCSKPLETADRQPVEGLSFC